MTTVPLFSRQNDVGLCALNVFLWENLVHVFVHVLENLKLSIIDQARAQGHILFCLFEDHDEVEVHKKAKRERSQYPAILTELDWSMKDLLYGIPRFFVLPCGTCQAFGLLCIAILCSGSSNFYFETIFHSLTPLCGKRIDSSLRWSVSKAWAALKIHWC